MQNRKAKLALCCYRKECSGRAIALLKKEAKLALCCYKEIERTDMKISVGILTISDKGSKGERIDKSGQVIREMVEEELKARVKKYEVVPDEKRTIIKKLKKMVDDRIDLILTTGGTGLSPRDVTPEATMEVIEKEVPGIEEAMRIKGLEKTPHSMLSRGVAGVVKGSLIINLPGSPKAVRESLEVVLPAIPHALDIISGRGGECGKS